MKKTLFIFALLMNFQTDVLSDENNYLFKQEKILPANEVFVISTKNEYFGKTKIYKDYLKIVFNDNYDESDHAIFYQGCAEQGFCYPIQKYIL